jgi:hypothetical protein
VAVLAFIFLGASFFAQIGNSLLNAVNNSAVNGSAQYLPAGYTDQSNHLQLSANGLTPNGQYDITIDSQSCGGAAGVDLGTVNADGSGNINRVFTLGQLDPSQSWYVDIHQGDNAGGKVLACGLLTINSNGPAPQSTQFVSLNVSSTEQVSAPTIAGPGQTSSSTTQMGFPNTGVRPGDKNHYDNNVYPRKF